MERKLKILKDDLDQWHDQDNTDLNYDYIFSKKQYDGIKIHSFNNITVNRKLLWNFKRNIGDLYGELVDLENSYNGKISTFKKHIRISESILWKILRKLLGIKYHRAWVECFKNSENNSKSKSLDSAICFIHSGDDHSWSHFMLDTSHLVAGTINFLKKNKKTKILLYNAQNHIEKFLRNICKIENEITYLWEDTIKVKNLFITTYFPHSTFVNRIVPMKYLSKVRQLYQQKLNIRGGKYLIYQTRKNVNRRKVINEDQIIDLLKNYSMKNNLEFIEFVHSNYEYEERFDLYYNSQIIVAPHGGACCHMYACRPNTIFIEFVVDGSFASIASSLVDYHILFAEPPFEGSDYHKNYSINIEKLSKILNNKDTIELKKL